jgi:hypothetical protein
MVNIVPHIAEETHLLAGAKAHFIYPCVLDLSSGPGADMIFMISDFSSQLILVRNSWHSFDHEVLTINRYIAAILYGVKRSG